MTDWIRYKDQFISVEQMPGGRYAAEVTSEMPDVPVRDMLVAATFEGSFIQQAPVKMGGSTVSIFKPTDEQAAAQRKARANYPWPVKIILGLIEIALYLFIASIIIAVVLTAIGWLIQAAIRLGGIF